MLELDCELELGSELELDCELELDTGVKERILELAMLLATGIG